MILCDIQYNYLLNLIMQKTFYEKLKYQCESKKSRLCIRLDVDYNLLPDNFNKTIRGTFDFLKIIIDSTSNLCVAYKLNMGFFEQFGSKGYELMEKTVEYIDGRCITIADGKRGDIGNSSKMYAKSIFNQIGFDSATVSPYMGMHSVTPFLEDDRFGAFVLCLTSNPGSNDFQKNIYKNEPLFINVLNKLKDLKNRNLGIVVGATQENDMRLLRESGPHMNWLIPGIGKQGGNLEMSVSLGNQKESFGIINVSRDILYYEDSSEHNIKYRADYYHQKIKESLNYGK